MAAKTTVTLYDEVTRVTYEYLGPAADRFIARQIENHLNKAPHQLQKKDLMSLIDWIKIAMNLLSDDKKLVNQYAAKLHELAQRQQPVRGSGQKAAG